MIRSRRGRKRRRRRKRMTRSRRIRRMRRRRCIEGEGYFAYKKIAANLAAPTLYFSMLIS